jgi:hypothetical protein
MALARAMTMARRERRMALARVTTMMMAITVRSTIMGNCFLGLCQNPKDPYII